MLKLGDIDFEDTTIPWDKFLEEKEKMPLGAVPVLKIDGQTFCQTKAINKYLARKAGLMGKDALEEMQIDMLTETHQEFGEKSAMAILPEVAKEFPPSPDHPIMLADPTTENK